MKEFECKDVFPQCDFKVHGESEDEVLDEAAQHGKQVHGIERMDEQIKKKIRSLIHDRKEVA